jgi:hypothetical protein
VCVCVGGGGGGGGGSPTPPRFPPMSKGLNFYKLGDTLQYEIGKFITACGGGKQFIMDIILIYLFFKAVINHSNKP